MDTSKRETVPSFLPSTPTRNCVCDVPLVDTAELELLERKLEGTVLVDMDNTLNDWDSQFRRVMEVLHKDFTFVPPQERRHYSMEQNYPPEWTEKITELTRLRGFWSTMPQAPGAVAALKEMAECGLDVWIVSAPDGVLTGRCALEKYEWIEHNLGPQWKSRLILTQDKTLVHGDLLIDDKPTAAQGMLNSKPWLHVAYCQPYNEGERCPNAVGRLHHWNLWRSVIPQLLEVAQKQRQQPI